MLWVLLMTAAVAAAVWFAYSLAAIDQLRRAARRAERRAEEVTP